MSGQHRMFKAGYGQGGIAAALLAAGLLLAPIAASAHESQLLAETDSTSAGSVSGPMASPGAVSSGKQSTGMGGRQHGSPVDRVEGRIKDLHDKLKITRAQEDLWANVAQSMRASAGEMEPLVKARADHSGTATAVEDLQSYGQLAEAHAESLKKFGAAFAPLYDSMSDVQKKNADMIFRGRRK